jgi:UDP-glucose 4-epimerase
MKQNVLITGVGGFIASKIALKFLNNNFNVYGIDDFSTGKVENVPKYVTLIRGDLTEDLTYTKIPENIDYVLHLAGQSSGEISFDNPVSDLNKNTISTIKLISFFKDKKVKKFLYASSMSVYGNVDDYPVEEDNICEPLSCYGVGKLASEGYLKVFKNTLPYVIFRMFNVYGPGQDLENLRQGMISIYLSQAIKNKHIIIKGSISRYRDLIYIDDVVEAWWRATIDEQIINETLNLATGKKTTIQEIINIIQNILTDITFEVVEPTKGDQNGIYANVNKTKRLLNIKTFLPFNEGVLNFIKSINM